MARPRGGQNLTPYMACQERAGCTPRSMAIDHDQIFRLLGRKNYDSGTWDLREAARLMLKQLEPYNLLFYEDPIAPENYKALAKVAANVSLPIAAGERHAGTKTHVFCAIL